MDSKLRNIWRKEYRKTKKGLIEKIYDGQCYTSKTRGHNPPSYTKRELEIWVVNQSLVNKVDDQPIVLEISRKSVNVIFEY